MDLGIGLGTRGTQGLGLGFRVYGLRVCDLGLGFWGSK